MTILPIQEKESYRELLYLADESWPHIASYLARGQMFGLFWEERVIAQGIVTRENKEIYELQSLSVLPDYQRKGMGRQLVRFLEEYCLSQGGKILLVRTGDSRGTVSFYRACGFVVYKRVPRYFLEQYSHPIYEEGKRLCDQICLKKHLD